nr:GNAT family N-acetyltransferase [Achromobacter aegrifaciens]
MCTWPWGGGGGGGGGRGRAPPAPPPPPPPHGRVTGYCFGDRETGEIVVLALLPESENQGAGKTLLQLVVRHLASLGHERLFLACASDPAVRSHGFYRHLGWTPTGERDEAGDDILELSIR